MHANERVLGQPGPGRDAGPIAQQHAGLGVADHPDVIEPISVDIACAEAPVSGSDAEVELHEALLTDVGRREVFPAADQHLPGSQAQQIRCEQGLEVSLQ